MNIITINGKRIIVSGNNISVINNKVYVDGKLADTGEDLNGIVSIKFEGDLANIKCGGDVEVTGNVSGYIDCGGSVKCGDVGGDVDAGGSVTCGKVNGDVDAGGSVKMIR